MIPDGLLIYCTGTFLLHFFILLIGADTGNCFGLQWINPMIIYREVKVNWFGCIVLTILAHIVAGPWCLLYWFYKLCTIGRKEEE